MPEKTIKARIQHLHKTESEWQAFESENPEFIFRAGELIIYDIDQNNTVPRFKFGNGTSKLSDLPFAATEIDFDAGRITDYID
jgi:hypothetical protein